MEEAKSPLARGSNVVGIALNARRKVMGCLGGGDEHPNRRMMRQSIRPLACFIGEHSLIPGQGACKLKIISVG